MSPSLKSRWQITLAESELGLSLVGAGVILSLHAKADGSGVWPSMEDEADRIGCSRDTLAKYRAALVALGWLTFVAKVVPNVRGIEYRLTIPEVSAEILGTHPDEMSADILEVSAEISPMSAEISPMSAETVGTNMTVEHDTLEHDTKNMAVGHECSGIGEHAWCGIEAEPLPFEVKAAAEKERLAEAIAQAPDF